MIKYLLYTICFVLIASCTLISRAPASKLWSLSQPHVAANIKQSISHVTGNIFSGSASISYKTKHIGILSWKANLLHFYKGDISLQLSFIQQTEHLNITLTPFVNGLLNIKAHGAITSHVLNLFLEPHNVAMTQGLQINDVSLTGNKQKLTKASGIITINRGKLEYNQNGEKNAVHLPTLVGTISQKKGILIVDSTKKNTSHSLAKIRLSTQGIFHLAVSDYLIALAQNKPLNPNTPPKILLEIEQKLF